MRIRLILAGFLLLAGPAFSQSAHTELKYSIFIEGREVALKDLGKVRIEFKDGTAKKNCILREIGKYAVIYVKEQVLHDANIDKIRRIEMEGREVAIYFDEKNSPYVESTD